jgi:FkbM family methyltransferase
MARKIPDFEELNAKITDLRTGKRKLVLWGAGKRIDQFIEDYCDNEFLPKPHAIFDSIRQLPDVYAGIPTISISDVHQYHPSEVVIVITAGLMELQGRIVHDELYYFDVMHRLSIDYFCYYERFSPNIQEIIEVFHDDKSKQIYLNRLQQIIDGALFNSSLYSYPPYFGNELIKDLSPEDGTVILAGAFNGKHIDNMLRNTAGVLVNGFEPSPYWSKKLNEKYKYMQNIEIQNLLLWHSTETLHYDEDLANGGLDARVLAHQTENSKELQAASIDQLYATSEKIGTIILDVEGSEQKVIEGAKKTIDKWKPNLCVCIYHTENDFFRIPVILKERYGNYYNFYLRQHSPVIRIETVMYALKKQ